MEFAPISPRLRRVSWPSHALGWLAALGCWVGCQGGYSLPPTACDDFCHATQRAGCEEDYPEGCVSECEDEAAGRVHPECEAPWLALTACYLDAPSSAFHCVEDESVPRDDVCLTERAELAGCVSPGSARCVEHCFYRAGECGTSASGCEESCYEPVEGCAAEQLAYDTCSIGKPVYCGAPEDDPRRPEEIPCLDEIGALLACAGFTNEDP